MKTSLNFSWDFFPNFDKSLIKSFPQNAEKVDFPHSSFLHPINDFSERDYQGVCSYHKLFDYKKKKNERLFLCFEGVMLKVRVFLNGHDLGEKVSGYLPIEFEISKEVIEKNNELLVVVDSNEDPNIPPFGGQVDYMTFGGIYRPVYLESRANTYIKDLYASGEGDGHLSIHYEIEGKGKDPVCSFSLFYHDRLIETFKTNETKIQGINPWSIEAPCLYDLKMSLTTSEGTDEKTTKVGFRSLLWDRNGFFLNGKKIKLIGVNRHQTYPYCGAALPAAAQHDDASIIKIKMGCSIVRTSHYPQSEAFLDACDELGLLVIDEVPGWQHIGESKTWRNNYADFIERMVKKERIHPSLIAYGVRIDESNDDDELYSLGNNIARRLDPYRFTIGVRNTKDSHCLEDVYGYNDFSCTSVFHGLDAPKSVVGSKGKPLLITEHNGHMFPTKSIDNANIRTEQALRHLKVIDDAYGEEEISGAIGWCAFDYNTHKDFGSGDHICYHGVCDIFRNPKAASFAYSSQVSKLPIMWVSNPQIPGDNPESLLAPLVVFTNCDYIEAYKGDALIDVFFPAKKLYPHLPHPPIIIDDFIGASFKEEGWSKKDKDKMVKALNMVGQKGIAHIKKKDFLPYLSLIKRKRLSSKDLLELYYKYMTGWGKKSLCFVLKGYKDRQLSTIKKFGASDSYEFRYEVSKQILTNSLTYDVARVSVKLVDEFGSQLHYASDTLELSTSGPIRIIGPHLVSLVGGDISIYVASLISKEPTIGALQIKSSRGSKEIAFKVS